MKDIEKMSNVDHCKKPDSSCDISIRGQKGYDEECKLSLEKSAIEDSFITDDEQSVCEAQSMFHNSFRFKFWSLRRSPLSMIRGILYRLQNGILWKYNRYWEIENEERYNNNDFDEEEPFITEQRFLPANCILMGDYAIDKSYFPWHGHSFEDFMQLNSKLQECFGLVQSIQEPKDIKHFRLKYRTVYDSFFENPICLLKNDNNDYCFGSDGRHRIYAASVSNGLLPVWIIEYKNPRSVSIDYYKAHALSGTWRFLEEV